MSTTTGGQVYAPVQMLTLVGPGFVRRSGVPCLTGIESVLLDGVDVVDDILNRDSLVWEWVRDDRFGHRLGLEIMLDRVDSVKSDRDGVYLSWRGLNLWGPRDYRIRTDGRSRVLYVSVWFKLLQLTCNLSPQVAPDTKPVYPEG